MRQASNSTSTSYQPADPPTDPSLLQRYLREEFSRLTAAINAVADGFAPVVYAYPDKPRAGMLRNFDGVLANPGSGPGLYRFDGASWNFLG